MYAAGRRPDDHDGAFIYSVKPPSKVNRSYLIKRADRLFRRRKYQEAKPQALAQRVEDNGFHLTIAACVHAQAHTNVQIAHGRKAKSDIESILLANKNERQKIAAIKIAQGESETGTSRGKSEPAQLWASADQPVDSKRRWISCAICRRKRAWRL